MKNINYWVRGESGGVNYIVDWRRFKFVHCSEGWVGGSDSHYLWKRSNRWHFRKRFDREVVTLHDFIFLPKWRIGISFCSYCTELSGDCLKYLNCTTRYLQNVKFSMRNYVMRKYHQNEEHTLNSYCTKLTRDTRKYLYCTNRYFQCVKISWRNTRWRDSIEGLASYLAHIIPRFHKTDWNICIFWINILNLFKFHAETEWYDNNDRNAEIKPRFAHIVAKYLEANWNNCITQIYIYNILKFHHELDNVILPPKKQICAPSALIVLRYVEAG